MPELGYPFSDLIKQVFEQVKGLFKVDVSEKYVGRASGAGNLLMLKHLKEDDYDMDGCTKMETRIV